MSMLKKCSVLLLPTDEKASIFIDTIEPGVLIFDRNYVNSNVHWKDVPHQYLYITSDDKIEESEFEELLEQGLYFESSNSMIKIITTHRIKTIGVYKKIIATTDNINFKLNDGSGYYSSPKPSDSFISKYIEEYNKGNIITDVMVEYEQKRVYGDELDIHGYNVEVVKVNPKDNTITTKKVKDSWSREEVEELCLKFFNAGGMYLATEGKVYPQSDSFEEVKKKLL